MKALYKESGNPVALKIAPDNAEIRNEINLLRGCKSKHIVEFNGAWRKGEDIWVSVLPSFLSTAQAHSCLTTDVSGVLPWSVSVRPNQ